MTATAPGPSRRPTLSDVARRAGVSPMSVSRSLRGDTGVSAATRARVLEAVDELGYRPNDSARSLKLGRGSDLIGVVVTHFSNPFYSRLALGVEEVIEKRGKRVILGNTEEDPDRERELVQNLLERRVDGIVVVPSSYDHSHMNEPAMRGTPVVLAGRPPVGLDADCVLVDDFGGAHEVTRRLLAEGHRRIAFIGTPPAAYTGAERYRGYCAALDEQGVRVTSRYVDRSGTDTVTAEAAAARMLRLSTPPTAIFAANNRLALGVLRAIGSRDQIGFAAFDDLEYASLLDRSMTYVSFDAEQMGRGAGELLLRRLDERSAGGEERAERPASRVVVHVDVVTQHARSREPRQD
ncbi:LacI family DNA-binding transcriptional regulator [Phytoactinopolyspora halotolerans]|uniref:LacI family transcriptional regulator n=1 Tax=Phytoactinopolyspora halotolerans TaxID=1981512 RepID=A0A6L9SJE8_9ACTN|nr:LacI family DNA-binding transcriptional regulator [Phytoactinopolyspora halotolerans]NEE04200.1 LacI family transcriptional regulator [Phytoactinopolyspora halotolerans]